jgi:hypothetical protein
VLFLLAGLLLLALTVGLAEYDRRHPLPKEDEAKVAVAAKPELPALLKTTPVGVDAPASATLTQSFQALLSTEGAAVGAFKPVVSGPFVGRDLRGGFGAVLFLVDAKGSSALVRAVAGEGAKVICARSTRVNTLQVDGSTAFFAEGGKVLSVSARGDEAPVVRVDFVGGVVTSLAAVGDTVFVAVMPKDQPLSDNAVGALARVDGDGSVTLIAADQARPRDLVADGKGVFWVAGSPGSLWRAPFDGSFTSKVSDGQGPLALDGDFLVVVAAGELRRQPRAGGAPVVLAKTEVDSLAASSGLVRYTAHDSLFEVSAGSEPLEVVKFSGPPRGVALGGTSLYALVAGGEGSTLYAR